MWNPKYGSDGAPKWKNRNSGKIMICCNRSKLKYTYAFNLLVRNCKKKLGEKFFARNFKLVHHIISKKNMINRIYSYIYLLNKYNINYDIINYISEYIDDKHIDLERFYWNINLTNIVFILFISENKSILVIQNIIKSLH